MSTQPSRSKVAAGAAGSIEFELRLTGPSEALDRAFEAVNGGGARLRHLQSIYFDTPDRRLAARGFTLRLRDCGDGSFVQTVKADATAAARLELEAPVVEMRPDVAQLQAAPVRKTLGALFAEELHPWCASKVERRTKQVCWRTDVGRDAVVELALDRGLLALSDGRSTPLEELEIEGKAGSRQGVFAVARGLVAKGVTRLVARSKATRAADLLLNRPPGATKARRARLAPDLPLGRALGRMLESCYAHWYANHDAAHDGRDPEGVHQLRVAIRRLRSLVTLFGDCLAPPRSTWLKTEAKAIMTALGPARDLDVFGNELLPPVAAAHPNDAALGELRVTLAQAHGEAYDAARAMLASERYTLFLLDLGAWIDRRGWLAEADGAAHDRFDRPLGPIADALLRQRAKVVRKRGRDFERLSPAARHEVRIALKKLRYAADFTRDLYPNKRVKPYLAHLARLQDAFGHLNDQAQAEALLDRLARNGNSRLQEARGLVLGWYGHAALATAEELVQDWRTFEAAHPFWEERPAC